MKRSMVLVVVFFLIMGGGAALACDDCDPSNGCPDCTFTVNPVINQDQTQGQYQSQGQTQEQSQSQINEGNSVRIDGGGRAYPFGLYAPISEFPRVYPTGKHGAKNWELGKYVKAHRVYFTSDMCKSLAGSNRKFPRFWKKHCNILVDSIFQSRRSFLMEEYWEDGVHVYFYEVPTAPFRSTQAYITIQSLSDQVTPLKALGQAMVATLENGGNALSIHGQGVTDIVRAIGESFFLTTVTGAASGTDDLAVSAGGGIGPASGYSYYDESPWLFGEAFYLAAERPAEDDPVHPFDPDADPFKKFPWEE